MIWIVMYFSIGFGMALANLFHMKNSDDTVFSGEKPTRTFFVVWGFWMVIVLMYTWFIALGKLVDRSYDSNPIAFPTEEDITNYWFGAEETFKKNRVVHLTNHPIEVTDINPICGTTGNSIQATRKPSNVTCKKCLALIKAEYENDKNITDDEEEEDD